MISYTMVDCENVVTCDWWIYVWETCWYVACYA